MEINVGFKVLGLSRGTQEADVRKAYRQLALQFHPDRNPAGAEMFKRVNEAYEVLQKHYKSHGGIDIVLSSSGTGGGGGAARAAGFYASSPLFTDEELFGGNVGGFASGAGHRATRRHHSRPSGEESTATTPGAGGGPNETGHASAQRRREAAHGHRQPVSGYDPFGGDPDAAKAFDSQRRHFEDMERRKNALFGANGSSARDVSGGGSPSPPVPAPGAGAASPSSSSPKAAPQSPRAELFSSNQQPPTPPARAVPVATRASGFHAGVPKSAREMEEAWRAEREAMQRELESETYIHQAEQNARRRSVEEETRREWEATMKAMEEETRRNAAAAAAAAATVRVEEDLRANEELRRIADERRKLRQTEYQRRMPTAHELNRMSEVEVYLMKAALDEAGARCAAVLAARQAPGSMCVTCGALKKDVATQRFDCQHFVCCAPCGRSARRCPLCESPACDF
jgi:curved DNA-binding protein CbpA